MRSPLTGAKGGVAILLALALMAFGMPVITAALRLSSTLAIDSRVKTEILDRQYCALGVGEYIRYLTLDATRWQAWWDANLTSAPGVLPKVGQEQLTIGGCSAINLSLISRIDLPANTPPVGSPVFQTTKQVITPATAPGGTANISPGDTVVYQITVQNTDPDPALLTTIYDWLPPGFGYVDNSTSGLTSGGLVLSFGDPCLFAAEAALVQLLAAQGLYVPCSVGSDGQVNIQLQGSAIAGDVTSLSNKVDIKENSAVLGNLTALLDVKLEIGTTVAGNITSRGSLVEVSAGAVVLGNITAASTVVIKDDAKVTGNIRAGGAVDLGKRQIVSGSVTSLGGLVVIKEDRNVQGDVWASGAVTLEARALVGGTITAGGTVQVKAGVTGPTEVKGNIVATGQVTLEPGSIVRGDVTSVAGKVVIEENVQVIGGNVWAAGEVTLKAGASIGGNVAAGGKVTVEAGVQVTGTVTALGGIEGAGAGAMQPGPGTPPPAPTPPPVPPAAQGSGQPNRLLLTWNVSPPGGLTLQNGDSVTLNFTAKATATPGIYCNQAWVDPGGQANASPMTAKVNVGGVPGSACPTATQVITQVVAPTLTVADTLTSYTYTITIDNTAAGATALRLSKVQDLLPAGFSYYDPTDVLESFYSQGNPDDFVGAQRTQTVFQGQQLLTWTFDPDLPANLIPAGGTKTLFFKAKATASQGVYFSEIWVTFEEVSERLRSWPTAIVRSVESADGSGDLDNEEIVDCSVLFDGTSGAVGCVILP